MIIKEVKMYSNRKRINIVKDDGFEVGDQVVVIPIAEYDALMTRHDHLQSQVQSMKDTNENLEAMMESMLEKSITPIHENYRKQLADMTAELKKKDDIINQMRAVCSRFNTSMSSLSAVDVIFRKKHKKVIDEFHDAIWIKISDYENLDDADLKVIPSSHDD